MPEKNNIAEAETHLPRIDAEAAVGREINIKAEPGKLEADPRGVLAAIEPAGFELLRITGSYAAAVVALPPLHGDPFDRMLVAQARTEPLILLTNDAGLTQYGTGSS